MRRLEKIEISHKTIIFTFFFIGLIWFMYFIKDILLQIFVALLIMTILNPTVTKLNKRFKVPRVASVLIVYAMVIAFVVFTIVAIVPPLIEQSTAFGTSLPKYLSQYNIPIFVVEEATKQFTNLVAVLPSQIVAVSVAVLSNLISVLTVMFFALYFLLSRNKFEQQLTTVLSKETADRIDNVLKELEKHLGGWARAQLILMLLVGASTYIGVLILGIPYAIPLALLAGMLEIVPTAGPFIASVPLVLVGFGVSPLTGLAAAALAFLIQQIENYFFVPKVMEREAGVSPIFTLAALLIGFRLAGIAGAILSVPVVITSKVLLQEFVFHSKVK